VDVVKLAVLAAALSACYSPSLRDCTVTCAAAGDCASGQLCGSDHLCAAPEVAGQCGRLGLDAGEIVDARTPVDASGVDAGPDAALRVTIHLHVDRGGFVMLGSGGSCDGSGPTNGDCMLSAPRGVPNTLQATEHANAMFDKWTGGPCDHQGALCLLTPEMNLDIHARFQGG
jgi:uncharacterized protein (DUF779 family)